MLGGARSGKSALAEAMVRELGGDSVLYIATADLSSADPDLAHRVEAHRERRPRAWETLEVRDLPLARAAESAAEFAVALLDSLTLWTAARMDDGDGALDELAVFIDVAQASGTRFVVVSDEVGLGVVPETASGRAFRDLLGLANARVATAAREVHLCVAGIGIRIK